MITPYNDITMTNRIDLGSEQGRLAKRILRKHTSHPDRIRETLKSGNPNRVRKYMNSKLEQNTIKIISLIKTLKKEDQERRYMLNKISKIADFSKTHNIKSNKDKANKISDIIWKEVMETLQETENRQKQTLIILAHQIYKVGGLKNKVQKNNGIIANLDKEVRPKTIAELIKKRNLKVKIKQLRTRSQDIKKLNESVRQNEEIIVKLQEMIAPLAKKHNIKVKSEDTKSDEAYTNEYKSIFKNEIKINKSN
jgi:hypothetical protein